MNCRAVGAVLFDLDGVLIDSYQVWFHLMNAAARALGYPPIAPADFHACWGQGVAADRERFFPRHDVADLEAYYEAHFRKHLEHLKVSPEVPEVFAALEARGLASAVITNTPTPLARDLVARAGARPAVVVGGSDVVRAKPAPDMVLRACALLAVAPARALVVGDSRYDREAARAAGARFAGLGIGGGELELASLAELAAHL
jgi:HAD superfamily hydrolase (TIGR01509 family)